MAFSLYFGTDAVDTHTGGSGQDWIWGGAGIDTLLGGEGDDFVYGGAGDPANKNRQTLRGGDGNDVIHGGEHSDRIYGDDGDDMLFGGGGGDKIEPSNGHDLIDGGAGDDDLVGGAGNDTIRGGEGNDHLSGQGGNDKLDGGPGNDRLRPSSGDDVMTGGDDADKFVFNNSFKNGTLDYGTNFITDFGDGADLLVIKGSGGLATHEARQAWIDSAVYWGTTTESGSTTEKHVGATLDFKHLAVDGLSGIIHIQFASPAGDLSDSDFEGWS